MIAALLTDVPGSSDYFLGGVVVVRQRREEQLPRRLARRRCAAHGAVSEEAAREMARGARERFGADLAAAVTGIAGPDGGLGGEAGRNGLLRARGSDGVEIARKRFFGGDRAVVRRAASLAALELVRRRLAGILAHE